jgi:GNAT superfamily N-acetyltransferase
LLAYNNRLLLAGNSALPAFNVALREYFWETLIPARQAAGSDAVLACFTDGWEPVLDEIFRGCEIIHAPRQYYQIENPDPAPELRLPAGFSLQPVTAEFLASGISGLDALREEMCSERTSVEDFLEKSFGICPVCENTLAGWCLSEYNFGTRCEIGIATLEPYQRQGLATLTTKAFLAEAARRGYTHIGWDCWTRNLASAATARKAGLTLVEDYPAVVAVFATA